MSRRSDGSHLSVAHLRSVLTAIASGSALPATPLREFAVVQARLKSPDLVMTGPLAADYVLTQWLSEEITAGLAQQRQYHGLSVPDFHSSRKAAIAALRQDFQQDAPELEAWSLLFFRYNRSDLGLATQDLEDQAGIDSRQRRRRQERGLHRLLHRLMLSETAARRAQRIASLQSSLPITPVDGLIGRSDLVQHAWEYLAGRYSVRGVVFTGPGGIGKTALASVLANKLIADEAIEAMAWLTLTSDMMVEAVIGGFAELLDIVPAAPDLLREYCQSHDVLLVLEGDEQLRSWSADDLARIYELGTVARLIITSRVRLADDTLPTFVVPELSKYDAYTLMRRVAQRRVSPSSLDDQRCALIWQQAGGNPLAVQVIARLLGQFLQGTLTDLSLTIDASWQVELFTRLYESAWSQLSQAARRFWLAAWLLPDSHLLHDLMVQISGLPAQQIPQAVGDLREYSLLDGTAERYRLHRTARMYLAFRVADDRDVAALARRALRPLHRLLPILPNASLVVRHLLSLSEVLGLSSAYCVSLIKQVWSNINRQAAWAVWLTVLQTQCDRAKLSDHTSLIPLLRWLGVTQRWLGNHTEAEQCFLQALHLLDRFPDEAERAQTLIELVVVLRHQEHWESAQATVRLAQSVFQTIHDSEGQQRTALELAQLALDMGEPNAALDYLESLPTSARSLGLGCNAQLALGNVGKALSLAEQAVVLAGQDQSNQARAQSTLGRVHLALGRLDEAEGHLTLGMRLLQAVNDMLGWARTASALAQLYYLRLEYQEVINLLQDAESYQRLLGDDYGLMMTLETYLLVYTRLAEMAVQAGQAERAAEYADDLRRLDAEWQQFARHYGRFM